MDSRGLKEIRWIGPSKEELKSFPREVRADVGFALHLAQEGLKHPSAKPLRGFRGAGVLEVVSDFNRNTFRTVYTLRMPKIIYVLLSFQKKSTRGIETPKRVTELIISRLKDAEDDY